MTRFGRLILGSFADHYERHFGAWAANAMAWMVSLTIICTLISLLVKLAVFLATAIR